MDHPDELPVATASSVPLNGLEDLGNGQHRALGRVLTARTPDPARVTRQNPVILARV